MKWISYLAGMVLCIVGGTALWNHVNSTRVSFTCVGGFTTEINHDKIAIRNVSDITVSFFNNNKIFMAIDGSVTANGKRYHMSRELWFSYQPVDMTKGIIRARLIELKKTGADNIEGDKVNHYILGAEPDGRIFRLWKLKDNILLIGNAFSPVLSCNVLP